MKDNLLSKYKYVLFVLIISLGVVSVAFYYSIKEADSTDQLSEILESTGRDFYENFYYNRISEDENERIELLKKYETIGIKVDLDNLSRYNNSQNNEKITGFLKDKNECSTTDSKVTIYPKSPFTKKDYTIEVLPSCN